MSEFDVETLNLVHQDVAFELQCASVRYELCDQLALQAEVQVDGLFALATIKLNDDFRLLIRPSHAAFNGVSTWFKWHEVRRPSSGEVMIFCQARCVVELQFIDPGSNETKSLISFGLEAQNLEQLIQKALTKFQQHCGLRLVALPLTKLNKTLN